MLSVKNILILFFCSFFLNAGYAKEGSIKLLNVSPSKNPIKLTYKICYFMTGANSGCTSEMTTLLASNAPLSFSGDGYLTVRKAVETVDGKEVAWGNYEYDYGCTVNFGWNNMLIFNDYNSDTVVCLNGYGLH